MIFNQNISKGLNSVKHVGGVTILFSAHRLMVVYNVSDIKVIEWTQFSYD